MIEIKIIGGLGNQLFQYSMAKKVALKCTQELFLDLSWFYQKNNDSHRKFKLFHFNTHFSVSKPNKDNAPFVGLFGTVWGIMDSFREIGIRGTTSLAVVAPGISEALVATALGLAAAIPAVLAYNYFLGRLKRIISKMENASMYIVNILEK